MEESALQHLDELYASLPENSRRHSRRTGQYMRIILRQMGFDQLEEDMLWGDDSPFDYHDIGKIKLPPSLLQQRWLYSHEEQLRAMAHVDYGGQIFDTLEAEAGEDANKAFFATAWQIAMFHHENFDGTGYPDGLKGEAIPFYARVCAVANAYDGLRNGFGIFAPRAPEVAIDKMSQKSGTWFDPSIVMALKRWVSLSPDAKTIHEPAPIH